MGLWKVSYLFSTPSKQQERREMEYTRRRGETDGRPEREREMGNLSWLPRERTIKKYVRAEMRER
jgi:hypothetical protein